MTEIRRDLERRREELRGLLSKLVRSPGSPEAPRLGDLATSAGMISREDLREALRRQESNGVRRQLIGEVLISGGYLSPAQLADLLQEQQRIAMSASDAAEDADTDLREISEKIRAVKGLTTEPARGKK